MVLVKAETLNMLTMTEFFLPGHDDKLNFHSEQISDTTLIVWFYHIKDLDLNLERVEKIEKIAI